MTTTSFPADTPLYPQEWVERYTEAGYWTADTFAELSEVSATRFGDLEAVVGDDCHGRRRRWTYRELNEQVGRLAAALISAGVNRGDRVLVQLPNTVDFVRVLLGVFRIGAIPVLCLPAHGRADIAHFLRMSGARAHVVPVTHAGVDYPALSAGAIADVHGPGATADGATTSADDADRPFTLVAGPADDITGDAVSLDTLVDGSKDDPVPPPCPDVAPTDLGLLQLSGGTTGASKLIPRTHAAYHYSIRASAEICGTGPGTRMLVVLPAGHNFTLSSPGILGILWSGGTLVFCPDPTPSTALGLVEQERITLTALVPPLVNAWLAALPRIDRDISSLQTLQVGGAPLTETTARRIQPELGVRLQQVFGMAEGLVCYTREDDDEETVLTTQGRPISPADEIEVRDEDGELLPVGAVGALWTRGPYTVRGYVGGVDRDSFDSRGFYRTGDLVRLRQDGAVMVTGRVKDQINRAGEKISPTEVENVILTHPAVRDVAVVPVTDDRLGERIVAFVIPNPSAGAGAGAGAGDSSGTDSGRALETELRRYLIDRGLARHAVPDVIHTGAEFPLTGVGKLSRRDLRERLSRYFQSQRPETGK
ncbi:AMP-binding protein [Corynebacterium bovis]|uniref:(2,3-dihydroxybenzoyl)adenylate synthase n=1 Tax=Corynebacterium bovis TaxID=36808 RepID=UPI002550380E|nr:AMP-binding protein [Corynebacterium bovis]MDK8511308.1 AMP-binding protein [Corynebacterium bovis]